MLNLIFVEAALETVPAEMLRHPSVRRNAKRRGKSPEETLLNRSLHHSAMRRLPDAHKRGRPDIVQICLLEALGAPLNREGGLRVWIHTFDSRVIRVSPEVRVPRDCNRFDSLMEQLLTVGHVPPEGVEPLMTSEPMSLGDLLKEIAPSRTIALTSHGRPSSLEEVCQDLSREEVSAVLIGAFPHGPLGEGSLSHADEAVSIHPEPLEAWVVTSRLVYEYERALGRT